MLLVFWDAEGIILAAGTNMKKIILSRSHKVSKAGNGKEKKKNNLR